MTTKTKHTKHGCNKGVAGWLECVSCGGRIHETDCTTKRNPAKDCCKRRHKKMNIPEVSAYEN